LAAAYVDAHKYDEAIVEYRHAEEMDEDDATPNVAIAGVLWTQGKQNDALAEWGVALQKLRATVDVDAVPESFWTNFATIARAAHDHGLGEKLKPAMNDVLVAYVRKNSNYRSADLLRSAALALGKENPSDAATWVLALIGDAGADVQVSMLGDLTRSNWFPAGQLDQVYQQEIMLATQQAKAAKAAAANNAQTSSDDSGDVYSQSVVTQIKLQYAHWLMKSGKNSAAEQVVETIGKKQQSSDVTSVRLVLAARLGKLAGMITAYKQDSTAAPSLGTLANVANQLRVDGDFASDRAILEYVFEQKLEQQQLGPTDYLALAEARLKTNDLPGALDLLKRLTQQDDLYANLDAAASLLMKTGHTAEALPMLTKLANGVPWDASYKLRLGKAQAALKQDGASSSLVAVAKNSNAAYSLRAEAALALQPLDKDPQELESAELTMLAAGTPAPAQAAQPYFVYAQMKAAAALPAAQQISLLEGAAMVAPESLLDWLRLQMFEAFMATGKFEQANAAMQPMLASQPWIRATPSDTNVETEAEQMNEADADNSTPANTSAASAPPGAYSLNAALGTDTQKIAFELMLSEMDEHLGKIDASVQDLESAQSLMKDAAQRQALNTRISVLRATSARDAENASRRPAIKDELALTVVVRPRLAAPARRTP
jgi:tetratricopeptide (TPR) repeat protein